MATSASKVKSIPAELQSRRQWLRWYYTNTGQKMPVGKSNDSSTWTDFDSLSSEELIAFVISDDDPFTGIDLDGCIVDGEYTDWAKPILERFAGVAYCEVSPSGKGVKLTTRAKKPDGARCTSEKFGEGKQQLECYDRVRFWTVTGNVVEGFESIGDGQEAVNWLCSTYLSGEARKSGTKHSAAGSGAPRSLLDRAQLYADNCKPASKGALRNTVFFISGNLHAFVGEHNERLTDNEVYFLLRGWNARNSDQLRDDELQEASVNGRTNGTPPEDKPPKTSTAGVDLSGLDSQPLGVAGEVRQDLSPIGEKPPAEVDENLSTNVDKPPAEKPATLPAEALLANYLRRINAGELPQLIQQRGALEEIEIGPEMITVIGAPPGIGKTALASHVMFDALELDGSLRCVVANAETTFDGLLRRELTRRTRIDSRAIRFGRFIEGDIERINTAASELAPRLERVSVLDDPFTVMQLWRLRDEVPGLLIVDYIQQFAPSDKDARAGVNEVMRVTRQLAKLGWSVVALSATKRDANGKHDAKSLSLSSFRESGEIEYNADSAYVMQDNGPLEHDYIRHVTLGHLKNRHGAKVDKQLRFHMPRMEFTALEPLGLAEFGSVVDVDAEAEEVFF